MKKIKSFFENHGSLFIVLGTYCFLQYIYYFRGGTVILGGEGNNWIDFKIYLEKFFYSWQGYEAGMLAVSLCSIFVYPILFYFIQSLFIKSFLLTASLFCLPIVSMYALLMALDKDKRNNRGLILSLSVFYAANPFSVQFLYSLNPWNAHILFIFPLYLLIIKKFYKDNFKLFFVFGICSMIFAYTYTNPPLLFLIALFLTIFVIIVQLAEHNKFFLKEWVAKSAIIYTAFFLFNVWWIFEWFVAFSDMNKSYTLKFASLWIGLGSNSMILKDVFSFSWLTSSDSSFHYLARYYNLPVVRIFLYVPFLIVLSAVAFRNRLSENKKIVYFLLGILAVAVMFMKGNNYPFKNFILYCFQYVPTCKIFKTAPEKFGVVFIFLFTILTFYLLKDSRNKFRSALLGSCLAVCLVPFFVGQFIPGYKLDDDLYSSRKYIDLDEFKNFRREMSQKKLDQRILSLPGSQNYVVNFRVDSENIYAGVDPLVNNIPQPYLALYSGKSFKDLFSEMDSPYHQRMLSLYNVRSIFLNKRFIFGFDKGVGDEEQNALEHQYALKFQEGGLFLYNNDYFLGHIYTPKNIVVSRRDISEMKRFISSDDYEIRTGLFLESQNQEKIVELNKMTEAFRSNEKGAEEMVVEYKKINPTKYRVIIHRAAGVFPIILSESFHDKWKAYPAVATSHQEKYNPGDYRVLQGNEADQASQEELASYVESGWVSTLGDPLQIKFISKNFQGTIQNDNLPEGKFYETWFKQSLDINNHVTANGYANSWIVDADQVCSDNERCVKNPDGTYDMELVLEFWPQRIFSAGLMVTAIVILICFVYFVIDYYNRNKAKSYGTHKIIQN